MDPGRGTVGQAPPFTRKGKILYLCIPPSLSSPWTMMAKRGLHTFSGSHSSFQDIPAGAEIAL
jgi:hypothetical protein